MTTEFLMRQLGLAKLSCQGDELAALRLIAGPRLLSTEMIAELRKSGFDSWHRLLTATHADLLDHGVSACHVYQLDRVLDAVGWRCGMPLQHIDEQLSLTILPAEIIANSPVT